MSTPNRRRPTKVCVPEERFALPKGYARAASGTQLLVEKAQRTWEREEREGRSPAPGCREAWDGRETSFAGCCNPPFQFDNACPRARLEGVCEGEARTSLEYYYQPGGKAVCTGRWFDVP